MADVDIPDRWRHVEIIHNDVNIAVPMIPRPGNYLAHHEATNIKANLQLYTKYGQLKVSGNSGSIPGKAYCRCDYHSL